MDEPPTIDGKSVLDLKVTELKEELGKRSLSKTGNKQQLVARLTEYLTSNPEPATSPLKEKSPDKKADAPNDFIAQYLADRDRQLAESLAHKSKVQRDLKADEEEENTENTEMPTQSLETAGEPSRSTEDISRELSPTVQKRRSTPTKQHRPIVSSPPPTQERENGSLRVSSPELGVTRIPSSSSPSDPLETKSTVASSQPETTTKTSEGSTKVLELSQPVVDVKESVSDKSMVSRDNKESLTMSEQGKSVVEAEKAPEISKIISDNVVDESSTGKTGSVPLSTTTATHVKDSETKDGDKVASVTLSTNKPTEVPTPSKVNKEDQIKADKIDEINTSPAKDITKKPEPAVVKKAFVKNVSAPATKDAVAASEEKPAASARKLTESLSMEEEKLDYGEAEDDVMMKEDLPMSTSTSKPTTVPTSRKRSLQSALELTPSAMEKSEAVDKKMEPKEIREPPRKMARSGLGSVSEESRSTNLAAPSDTKSGSPPPSKVAASRMLHIRNLVRPFTIPSLKELLRKTGTIIDDEDHFWTDAIKSQCIVTYATEDEANATRRALYDFTWPPSNARKLLVDFIKEDEFKEKTSTAGVVLLIETAAIGAGDRRASSSFLFQVDWRKKAVNIDTILLLVL